MQQIEIYQEADLVAVKTYSPTLDQYEIDDDSQFSFAIDFDRRFDFTFPPTAAIVAPLDNGPGDQDPDDDAVLVNTTQAAFQIQLADFGDGVDDATVTVATIAMLKDGVPMTEGSDYAFGYDPASDLVTLDCLSGEFGNGVYEITVSGGMRRLRIWRPRRMRWPPRP